jgi:hypothetical protein
MFNILYNELKINSFKLYWESYGGFKEILRSPYFRISIIISVLLTAFGRIEQWYELPLTILPNILGFSIGAYAILLALGDNKFWKLLANKKKKNEKTPYMIINGTFVHFIFVQVLAIIYALSGKILCLNNYIFAIIGIFFLVYAILCALASTLAVLKLADWYQTYLQNEK